MGTGLWLEEWSSAGGVHWSSDMEGDKEQCSKGSTGAVHWREARGSRVERALEQCSGGGNGAVPSFEDCSSALEGAMEKCTGCMTGEVQWRNPEAV